MSLDSPGVRRHGNSGIQHGNFGDDGAHQSSDDARKATEAGARGAIVLPGLEFIFAARTHDMR